MVILSYDLMYRGQMCLEIRFLCEFFAAEIARKQFFTATLIKHVSIKVILAFI